MSETSQVPINSIDEDTKEIEILIDLKFSVEKELNTLFANFERQRERKIDNNSNLDISLIVQMYNDNISKTGELFIVHQSELLERINALLLKKCNHIWIDDVIDGIFSSRNYCYCSKCFLRKTD